MGDTSRMPRKVVLTWTGFAKQTLNPDNKTWYDGNLKQENGLILLSAKDGRKIIAHKTILSSALQAYTIELENNCKELWLDFVELDDLKAVMDYIHNGKCEVDVNYLDRFLSIALRLGLVGLSPTNKNVGKCKLEEYNIKENKKESLISSDECVNAPQLSAMVKTSKTDLIYERQDKKEKPIQTCHICGKFFKKPDHLKTHLLIHSGEKPHKCEECQRGFTQDTHLKTHMLTHKPGSKNFSCETCGSSFYTRSKLKIHARKHMDEKPHQCDHCPYTFAVAASLRDHTMRHNGIKPYMCQNCSKSFTTHRELKSHISFRHNKDA